MIFLLSLLLLLAVLFALVAVAYGSQHPDSRPEHTLYAASGLCIVFAASALIFNGGSL